MYHRLLLIAAFCSFFTTILSIRCYGGWDNNCAIMESNTDCGHSSRCYCAKYRFTCRPNDPACTKFEAKNSVKKWSYTTVPKTACEGFKELPNLYQDAMCCFTDECNRPDSGKCLSTSRRKITRKLTDPFIF